MINPCHFQPLHSMMPSCKHTTCNTAREYLTGCQTYWVCVSVCTCLFVPQCLLLCVPRCLYMDSAWTGSLFASMCTSVGGMSADQRECTLSDFNAKGAGAGGGGACSEKTLCPCCDGTMTTGRASTSALSKHNHISLFPGFRECLRACNEIPRYNSEHTLTCWKVGTVLPGTVMTHWTIFQSNTPCKRWHIKRQGQKYVQLFPSNKAFLCEKQF